MEEIGEEEEQQFQASGFWRKEVCYGKQLTLMSQNTEPAQIKKYSFHTKEEFSEKSEEELEKIGAIKVSTEAELEFDVTSDDVIKKIDKVYQFDFVGIENKEWFKNHVFGLELESEAGEANAEDFKIQVITCTADDSELEKKIKQERKSICPVDRHISVK